MWVLSCNKKHEMSYNSQTLYLISKAPTKNTIERLPPVHCQIREQFIWWTSRIINPNESLDFSKFGLLIIWPSIFSIIIYGVPECVRICGFKRNSSNLYRAPKMRDSVLLNSWDSFVVTLPSISSETCVMHSLLILGTDVFRDWPFLGCSSCVFVVPAANFRLFFNVAIFWRENAPQIWRLNCFLFVNQLEIITKNVIL